MPGISVMDRNKIKFTDKFVSGPALIDMVDRIVLANNVLSHHKIEEMMPTSVNVSYVPLFFTVASVTDGVRNDVTHVAGYNTRKLIERYANDEDRTWPPTEGYHLRPLVVVEYTDDFRLTFKPPRYPSYR